MDVQALLKPRLTEEEVPIPGVGTIRVRGLTRAEVVLQRKATDDTAGVDGPRALVLERKVLALAMVDPPMTEGEVRKWQEASSAGELQAVMDVVQRLSGLSDDAPKSGLPADGDRPGD